MSSTRSPWIKTYQCALQRIRNGEREANLSRMNNIRSLANKPKLDKHEKPKSAKVKKKMPVDYAQNRMAIRWSDTYPIDSGIRRYRC